MVSAISSLRVGVFASAHDAMPRGCLTPEHVLQGEHGSNVAGIISLAKLTKFIPPPLTRPQHKAKGMLQAAISRKGKGKSPSSRARIPSFPFDALTTQAKPCIAVKKKKAQIFVVRGKNWNFQPLVINIINLAVQFHRTMSPQELSLGLFRITWKMSIVRDFKNFTYSCKKSFLNFLTCWNCYRST